MNARREDAAIFYRLVRKRHAAGQTSPELLPSALVVNRGGCGIPGGGTPRCRPQSL
jgi:hypothetical protein